MFVSRAALLSLLLAPLGVDAETKVPFSYIPDAENGPANWGKLAIDGNACDGTSNSPIAVVAGACDTFADYTFSGGACSTSDLAYSLTNTGVLASFPGDDVCESPTVVIPGIEGTYKALQFHIHTSSEHTINNMFYGAELHIVHQEVDGDRYAVVGMMIQPDSDVENEIFGQLLEGWQVPFNDADINCTIARGRNLFEASPLKNPNRRLQEFSPYELLPDGVAFFHYDGGLTTPPCSEVVWWNLADKPVSISPAQYHQLVSQVISYIDPGTCELGTYAGPVGSTSRPVQPLNGRVVERICPVGFEEETTECDTAASTSGASVSSVVLAAVGIAATAFSMF